MITPVLLAQIEACSAASERPLSAELMVALASGVEAAEVPHPRFERHADSDLPADSPWLK